MNQALTLLVLCGALLPARAAETDAVNAVQNATAPITAEAVIAKLQALDDSIQSLECNFKQSLSMADTGLTQEAEGKVFYRKPDGLRLEYDKPRRQTAVSDKKDIWIYQVDDNQVIRANWEDWKKNQFNVTGLLDFGNYSALLDKHFIEAASLSDGLQVTLRPKDKSPYTLTLILSPEDGFPSRWTLQLEKMTIQTELTQIKRNGKLADSLFHFKPPAGVPEINFSAPRGD